MPLPSRATLEAASLGAAVGLCGMTFGAAASAAGLPIALACAMSAFVFAGSAQFAAVAVLASGGGWAAAAFAGLLLNARYLGFGGALAARHGRPPGGGPGLLAHAWLLIDESAGVALAERDAVRGWARYRRTGLAIFCGFNAGTLVGAWLGHSGVDPLRLGLDAAMPAALLAVLWPWLHPAESSGDGTGERLLVTLVGAAVAWVSAPRVPAGVPVLLAALVVPLLVGLRPRDPSPATVAA